MELQSSCPSRSFRRNDACEVLWCTRPGLEAKLGEGRTDVERIEDVIDCSIERADHRSRCAGWSDNAKQGFVGEIQIARFNEGWNVG